MANKQAQKDRELWNSPAWTKERNYAKSNRSWYRAEPLQARQPRRDRETGNAIRQFPLDMNMAKLLCDIHRDLARGMVSPGNLLAITTSIKRGDDWPNAEVAEAFLNAVWQYSNGGPIQQEGLLDMNIYGGCVYQIAFEPWNKSLPHGIAVRLHQDPSIINPKYDYTDRWNMIQCHIGYEIDPEIAKLKYSIETNENGKALYMEEWTRERWEVRINGQVPIMKWEDGEMKLSGENTWGFVPVFYIPHERTVDILGDSPIEGTTELEKHINSRAGDISDLVHATRPGMLTITDMQTASLTAKPVTVEGNTISYALDLGRTQARPGAEKPELKAWPIVDIPPGLVGYPRELVDYWMMLARISPSVFGTDDTQSGRITGPAVQARMFTSMAHATTERMNYTTGKTLIDRRLIQIALAMKKSKLYPESVLKLPDLDENDVWMDINQVWPPSLLLDKKEMLEGLLARLQANGISIEEFLRTLGVQDIEGERAAILAWMEEITEITTPAPEVVEDDSGSNTTAN
jgi:hypothetical protein